MQFLNSSIGTLLALLFAIFAFGLGLTSPIWFLLGGLGPLEAMHAGTPIVLVTICGLMVTTVIGIALHRLRKPDTATSQAQAEPAPPSRWKHLIVHVLVVLMFVIPFLTIVAGILLRRTIDADAG